MRATQAPAPPATQAITAENVSFSYGERVALDDFSLAVERGSLFGLLGPNGSGKSTFLSLLAGLRLTAAGEVRVLGRAPSPALRGHIGYLFQESSLDPLMTAWETLWLHGRLYGIAGRELRGRCFEMLSMLGLDDRRGSLVRTLSGGLKRRLELARALLPAPELLLLDEPTTGLDPDSEQALWSHLADINERGVTVIMATNKVSEADRYCDRVAFVHTGRLAAQGSPDELKASLKHDGVWVEGQLRDSLIGELRSWPDVGELTWAPPVLHLTVDSAAEFVPRLFRQAGEGITAVRVHEATLEDAYFDVVGSSLAPEGEA